MSQRRVRELSVVRGKIKCLSDREESVEKCRFCVHSVSFIHDGVQIPSPARDFCALSKKSTISPKEFHLSKVSAVYCDDTVNEGFRSIMNIIG
jgi:hypothetical protein